MQNSAFVERLSSILQMKNLTRKELSALSGVSVQCLSDYFTQKKQPSVETLAMLARALNVSTDYLLGLSDVQTMDADMQAIHKKTGLSEDAITQLMGWKREGESDLAQLVSYIASYDRIMLIMSLIDNWLTCPPDKPKKIEGVLMRLKSVTKAALDEEVGEALNGYVKWLEGNFDTQTIKGRAGQLGYWYQHGKSWEGDKNG